MGEIDPVAPISRRKYELCYLVCYVPQVLDVLGFSVFLPLLVGQHPALLDFPDHAVRVWHGYPLGSVFSISLQRLLLVVIVSQFSKL